MIKAQSIGFVNTLPLWNGKQFDIQQFEFPSVAMGSFEPEVIPANLRIGHQMEYIFKQLVAYSEYFEILVYNLPIRKEKITLGEIDFILKEIRSGKLIHVELTYKYYIIDPEVSETVHRLIGPNRRDKFYDKMQKIKNRQFPLLHSDEGAAALTERDIDHLQVQHQCCFKAQLFHPYGNRAVDIGDLSHDCVVGYWLRYDDFKKSEFASARFYMPSKSEWVISPHDRVGWKSHSEISIDINERLIDKFSPLLWIKKEGGTLEKFFVVWW